MTETDAFEPFVTRMEAAGLSAAAIRAFEGNYRALERHETGKIAETELEPVAGLPHAGDLPAADPEEYHSLLRRTVIIKLNGGLGTGMGLEKAKSLLPVRDGLTFLDLIARQVLHLREEAGGGKAPRFLLMNSFSTSEDTLAFMRKYPAHGGAADIELMQNRVPKILASDLSPLTWPANPELEWCPPGHGDIYASLAGSGWLERLLNEGVIYAFVANADNLGATLDSALLSWFAHCDSPFAMEVTRRTEADRKGGHLARRRRDGRLILRESAQCSKSDAEAFMDIGRHQYFNTNNLWVRLDRLQEALDANDGLIPLPMIRNTKTADPRDAHSPVVYQLETAMGAAIESFEGAAALCVDRERFAPVKTTGDLLIIRSDACVLTTDSRLVLAPERQGVPPVVDLDHHYYKMVDGLDHLVARGLPSLVHCHRLKVRGPHIFEPGVVLRGDVEIINEPAG